MEECLLLLAAFAIPFANFAPVPSIVMSAMCIALYIYDFAKGDNKPVLNYAAFAMLAFYLFSILSSIAYGLSDMFWRETTEIRLPLLFFSIAFLFSTGRVDVRRLLRWFAMGAFACAIVCVIVYVCALCTEFDGVPRSFLNIKLCLGSVLALLSHRTYVAFNMLVGLIVFFQDAMDRGADKRHWMIFGAITLFTGFFILLSGARMVLFTYCLLLFLFLLTFFSRRYDRKKMLLMALGAMVILTALLLSNGRFHDMLISLFRGDVDILSLDPRFSIWHCAWRVIDNNDIPFMGVGTAVSPDLIYREFEAIGFSAGVESHYGMHNQFLESYVEYGIVGFLLLLAMLLPSFFNKTSNRLFFRLYALLLVSNLMFESMFSRSMGTYSIGFIIVLSGLRREPEQPLHLGGTLRKSLYALLLFAIVAVSIKYSLKDKRAYFSAFQRYFSKVDQLPGEVPDELRGIEGRRADCTTTSETWLNKATTYYRFAEYGVSEADSVDFSLYIYVSEDFDGADVEMKLEERGNFAYADKYDLEKKGTWQHLHVGKRGMYGNVYCTFAFAKEDASDLKDMKGFVIFAKPETECFKQ